MKKIIRSYFLAFAEETGMKNLMIAISSSFIVILILIMIFSGDITENNFLQKVGPALLIIIFGIPILNYILCKTVTSIFISVPPEKNDPHDSALLQIITREKYESGIMVEQKGGMVILNKPLWAKGVVYRITTKFRKSSWSRGYSNDSNDKLVDFLELQTKVSGKYKNSVVEIPVTIELYTEKEFNPIEVFEKMRPRLKEDETILNLGEYLQDVFKRINQGSQEKIQELIISYVEMKISESALVSEVIDLLIFPEKPFSNVENVKICLGAPTTSSCKGMVCGE